eukprot:scaffold579_cov129-Isochrysis_galbana.AAC.1
MGDPAQYPEVRMARFLYAMQWLPPDFRADYQARQQWIDNNPHNTTRRCLLMEVEGSASRRVDEDVVRFEHEICLASPA